MSRVHEEAEALLDKLLGDRAAEGPASSQEINEALERIEELSKLAQNDIDEAYLCSVEKALLQLRADSRE